MKQQITKENNELVIRIPLKQEVYNPYSDSVEGEIDNITGLIEGDRVGFAYLIDRSYKGKSPDLGTMFYEDYMEHDKFRSLCKGLGLGLWETPVCSCCGKLLYGSFTLNDNGYMCWDCSDKELKKIVYKEDKPLEK